MYPYRERSFNSATFGDLDRGDQLTPQSPVTFACSKLLKEAFGVIPTWCMWKVATPIRQRTALLPPLLRLYLKHEIPEDLGSRVVLPDLQKTCRIRINNTCFTICTRV